MHVWQQSHSDRRFSFSYSHSAAISALVAFLCAPDGCNGRIEPDNKSSRFDENLLPRDFYYMLYTRASYGI
jgi:hypothetical protein